MVSLLFLVTLSASAQKEYNTRLLVKSTIGYTCGLNSMFKNYPTDDLINYADESFQANFISNSLFFGKKRNWGIELSFLGNFSSRPDNKQFTQLLENSHNEYDVESSTDFIVVGKPRERC